ncbi:MAG TPA: ATP-binding protein [Polyangiaceae bacterium]|nr:ATP-binding protein [Polyangiaceae bacterium]
MSSYVLLIDDHEDSRELAVSWLELAGLSVASYGSAEEALPAIEMAPPSVVVTDVVLPGMSGVELARRLRDGERTRHVGLVALTGRSDVDHRAFDALLIKPYDPARLTAVVGELAARRSGLGSAALPSVSSTLPAAAPPPAVMTLRAPSPSAAAPGRLPAEQYRLLLEQAPTMLWRAGPDARCEWVNETWLAFTGRTFEQEAGEGRLEGVHPDDRARYVEAFLGHFGRREPFELEYRLRRRDGAYRWVFDRGVPLHDEGRFAGFLGNCVDVDERRRSDEAKAAFLSTMAHELRTPLTPLRAHAYQLRRSIARGEPPAEDQVRRLEAQIDRLVALVDHLGEAGRVAGGRPLFLEEETFDLAAVVREAVESERERLGRRRDQRPAYELTLRGADRPVVVRGDRARLGRALGHLLDNAFKFSPEGGPVEVTLEASGGALRLGVRDGGVGAPPAELEGLGRPYVRASNARLGGFPGVGLGLAMAGEIAAAHGGRLEFASDGVRGASAELFVPLEGGPRR